MYQFDKQFSNEEFHSWLEHIDMIISRIYALMVEIPDLGHQASTYVVTLFLNGDILKHLLRVNLNNNFLKSHPIYKTWSFVNTPQLCNIGTTTANGFRKTSKPLAPSPLIIPPQSALPTLSLAPSRFSLTHPV